MMKRLFSLILTLLMLLPTFGLFGCAESRQQTTVLRVCNCEDYIDEELLDEFTEETGIEVVYSTYGTNENLYNELVINPNSYDLVVPSEYMIEKLAVEGRIKKLDFNKIANYRENLSPFITERLNGIVLDDGSKLFDYMVGYMWGTMGWVYNTANVSEKDVSSWYGPFENSALNKKITIKDSVRDSYLVGLAMTYADELKVAVADNDNAKITQILNRTEQKDIDAVGNTLTSLRPKLYGFEVDSGKNDIVLGRIDAYVAWSGDAAFAIDVAAGDVEDEDGSTLEGDAIRELSYYIPEEGSNIWFDGFVMPSGSNNEDAAYKFLEFISRPSSVYRNMYYTGYTGMVSSGEFETEDEETGETYTTTIFDEVILGWFDSYDALDEEKIEVDFSYFFRSVGDTNDYTIIVDKADYGRLIAQYPTAEQVNRCAVMSYFDNETLTAVNVMWESVKAETFSLWLIIVFVVLIVFIAVFVVVYRNKDKFTWLKLPERKTSYAERKGLIVVKKEYLK